MQIKRHPSIMTVSEWFKHYSDFQLIFEPCETVGLLNPIFEQITPLAPKHTLLFAYLLDMYGSRPVIPEMTFDETKDSETITKIGVMIEYRANLLNYKYTTLSNTLFPHVNDYLNNYSTERKHTKGTTFTLGSTTNSGTDITSQKQHTETNNYTTTDDLANPRLESKRESQTVDGSGGSDNLVSTTYGHKIETQPSNETESLTSTSLGYYNSGTKAKIIDEVRKTLNFNIVDVWMKDILPSFTYSFYDTKRNIPSEFLL